MSTKASVSLNTTKTNLIRLVILYKHANNRANLHTLAFYTDFRIIDTFAVFLTTRSARIEIRIKTFDTNFMFACRTIDRIHIINAAFVATNCGSINKHFRLNFNWGLFSFRHSHLTTNYVTFLDSLLLRTDNVFTYGTASCNSFNVTTFLTSNGTIARGEDYRYK